VSRKITLSSCFEANFESSRPVQAPVPPPNDPDWLPAAHQEFSTSCQVCVSVLEHTTGSTCPSQIHIDTISGEVRSLENLRGEQHFDVQLDHPFIIPISTIYVSVGSGKTGGDVTWRRSIPAQYELMVEIKCQDLEESAEFLALVENRLPSDYHGSLVATEGVLSAKWKELPNCPASDHLLGISRLQEDKRLTDFKYGMALSVGWSRKCDSPLVRYNRLRQHEGKDHQDQLPTPSASEGSDRHGPRYVVKYVLQISEERTHVVSGLKCPICSATRVTPEYSSFARLQLHLLTWHDHFRPEVLEEEKIDDAGGIIYTVRLWSTERPVDDVRELSEGEDDLWIAPSKPFDQSAYLKDQDTWTGHTQPKASKTILKKRPRDKESVAHRPADKSPKGSAPVTVKRPLKKATKLPQTSGLAASQKRRYRVPTVPGVRFYRTGSKRPFNDDEEVMESDDELDQSWLDERLHVDLSSLKLTPGRQDFLEDFNRFVATGAFAADVLSASGIIDFTQKHRKKACDAGWYAAFKERVQRLLQYGIIERADARQCKHLIKPYKNQAVAPPANATGGSIAPTGDGTGQPGDGHGAKMKAKAGHDVTRDTCMCGERADSTHGTIMCDGEDCIRQRFHMICLGLDQRTDGWLCADCKPSVW